MTLPHSDFNAVLVAARFVDVSDEEDFIAIGRIFEDRGGRFDDGSVIRTSLVLDAHLVSEGEWVIRTRNSLYHVFEVGFRGSAGMPEEVSEN
jgi:hypothetical protein